MTQDQITPHPWQAHILADEIPRYSFADLKNPFGFLEILEREIHLNDGHGPKRLAVLFLGADAVATYDDLFGQTNSKAPYAIIVQDHGFGGNYTSFGQGGLLEKIAQRTNKFPEWLLVAQNSQKWSEYQKINDVNGDSGGEWARHTRKLYRREKQ